MRLIKLLAAAAVMAVPILTAAAPADAATARQYEQQGRGHYVSSKGRTLHRMNHRYPRHHRMNRHYRGYR